MNREIENIGLVDNICEFLETLKQDIKIGLAFNLYLKWDRHRFISYKSFQRTIQELAERELVFVKKIVGGAYGTTTLILKNK